MTRTKWLWGIDPLLLVTAAILCAGVALVVFGVSGAHRYEQKFVVRYERLCPDGLLVRHGDVEYCIHGERITP